MYIYLSHNYSRGTAGALLGRPLRSSPLSDFGCSTWSLKPSRRNFGRSTGPIDPTRAPKVAPRGRPRAPSLLSRSILVDFSSIVRCFLLRDWIARGASKKLRFAAARRDVFRHVFASLCPSAKKPLLRKSSFFVPFFMFSEHMTDFSIFAKTVLCKVCT